MKTCKQALSNALRTHNMLTATDRQKVNASLKATQAQVISLDNEINGTSLAEETMNYTNEQRVASKIQLANAYAEDANRTA